MSYSTEMRGKRECPGVCCNEAKICHSSHTLETVNGERMDDAPGVNAMQRHRLAQISAELATLSRKSV